MVDKMTFASLLGFLLNLPHVLAIEESTFELDIVGGQSLDTNYSRVWFHVFFSAGANE